MARVRTWKERFEFEITRGEAARAAGNEGMARVCARRAAGLVIEELLRRRGQLLRTPSAYDHLRYLKSLPGISPEAITAAEHLLVRITPEHTLPVDADLIAEARLLRNSLLDETSG